MSLRFPALPKYFFTWRGIFIEPIPDSDERIAVGIVVKGADGQLLAIKIVPTSKLKSAFGKQLGSRIAETTSISVHSAEKYYASRPLSSLWHPPVEGITYGSERELVADDLSDGASLAAKQLSSLHLGIEVEKAEVVLEGMSTAAWRTQIANLVKKTREEFSECFDKEVSLSGHVVPLKIGFYSEKYAAHFSAISPTSKPSDALIRAQSKLWQLDMLRDSGELLFSPEKYELIFNKPNVHNEHTNWASDFLEEIGYEAAKRDIGLMALKTSQEAARHVITSAQ